MSDFFFILLICDQVFQSLTGYFIFILILFSFCLIAVIEIASGEYEQVDMSKLMAAAVKKYHEERDTYYLGTFNRDNYIRDDTGVYLKRDVYGPEFELMSYIYR